MIPVNKSAARHIETLVSEYLWTHPTYTYPPNGNKHPCVLALSNNVEPWMIDRLGDIADYLRAMLAAAREWFPSGVRTMEFRYFAYRFEVVGNLGAGGAAWYLEICKDYSTWRKEQKALEAAAIPVDGMAATLTVELPLLSRLSVDVPPISGAICVWASTCAWTARPTIGTSLLVWTGHSESPC
jgi:hypothetical protein